MSLFQTKAWQSAWWETWGSQKGFRLVRPWDGQVSGLYESKYRLKGVLPVRSFQFVGTSYRELRTPRTEYNQFCDDNLSGQLLLRGMEEILQGQPWTEAVFNDLRTGSEELSALVTIAATHNWAFRITASDNGYAVSTTGRFDEYIAALGANSRLRLYNRRKILESLGSIYEENLWPSRVDDFFQHLNRFHLARWKKNCVTPTSLEFHKKFLSRVEEEGGRPLLSALYCDGNVVSVLYNVWYQGVVYNIQAGFDEHFHVKLSLGSLHLGYAIENAFNAVNTHRFDMLAGQGKHEDYKSRFATDRYQFISIMLVKSVMFRALYWMRG
ncbi:GNAT family N-acetyltransferase [Marinobacter halophilus]|uniref:GNAT family N-acetyltransferase n=1 Tax=Marinobacter halophilus TaxID=1323740 RepID=A0A2T1KAA5_9GAMM|nr:GNAT family N-acetyltransferase [Marinobacter halophilus]PSF06482.1 GNAT family N-acetyltransferase [Marinobacter halophilus]GGC72974.1 hypothetical protein GCM10011362_21840 [Marinobacter halophilus]